MWNARRLTLILLLPAFVRPAWAQSNEAGPRARAACDSLARWLREVPAAELQRTHSETLYDRTADLERPACTLVVSGAWREVAGAPDPLELVERLDGWFEARGWREEPGFVADGAGSGSRGFVRAGLLCVKSSVWGGGREEEGLLDSYNIRIDCADRER